MPGAIGSRRAYHYLANADEYPQVLPFALRLVQDRLRSLVSGTGAPPANLGRYRGGPGALPQALEEVSAHAAQQSRPWNHSDPAVARRQVMHYVTQHLPTVLVDGCWLQGALRVATVHTDAGARLTAAYAHRVQAFVDDPGRHFVTEYRDLYRLLGSAVEDVSAPSFSNRPEFLDASFELPLVLLSLGQFPQTLLPEIVGLHLAWTSLDVGRFGRQLVRDARVFHSMPAVDQEVAWASEAERGRHLALEAARHVLTSDNANGVEQWRRVWSGLALGVEVWTAWLTAMRETAPDGPPDPRQDMIDLLWRKAPHAAGYHGKRRLGGELIDDRFRAAAFDAGAFLDHLAVSRLVTPGRPETSDLLRKLTVFGGPMQEVFSPAEIATIQRWIASLPAKGQSTDADRPVTATASSATRRATVTTPGAASAPARTPWSSATFRRDSERKYAAYSVRDLYHHLINVELSADVLPMAERFARERLERSMLGIRTGERPIPSSSYDPAAFDAWVHHRHRAQVDSYRPWNGSPRVSREDFIESTVQLAPVILIDGGWLQGIANPSLVHRPVGCMLFHVFYEEVGEGDCVRHHANIYRELLKAMGENAPAVETKAFAHWPRLRDASFEVPALWLSVSCFPRHFLPEILGLNLAVELAGVGGPYMEARDTLRHFGFPTLFVDVHNAADNVSEGHSAWAAKAIKAYMDDVTAREGPQNVDYHWHRIWSGVRATLPRTGFIRGAIDWMSAQVGGFPQDRRVPRIFRT